MRNNLDPRRQAESFVDRLSIVLALIAITFSLLIAVAIGALWFS